jgi:hypothetical protein
MAVNLVELTAIYGTQPLDYALRNFDNCHFLTCGYMTARPPILVLAQNREQPPSFGLPSLSLTIKKAPKRFDW